LVKRQLFLLFVVGLILFGSGGCLPTPTPKPTDTLAPLPTPTSKPTDTVAPTPTVEAKASPTSTSMPTGETLAIPIGIGIFEASNVEIFNKYAREYDVISARPPFLDLLKGVEVGRKMLNFNPRDEPLSDVGPIIAEARAMGVTILGYNLETVLIPEELTRKEIEMQTFAVENDLLYAFGPTIVKLSKHYDDFARHADILVLQSQRFQTTGEYEEWVEELIDKIRAANPEVQVWVLVSVNPPEKRHVTPDEVISDVLLIADKADLIWIYFGPPTAPVMEEVFKRLRQ
jgi:hypothetical protein